MKLFNMMAGTEPFKTIFQIVKDVAPVPSSGILTVGLVSCVLFGIQTYFNFTEGIFSIGASVFLKGQFHRLLMFPFYHRTLPQLLLNLATLAFFSGSLERGFGTVRFLFLFLLLSTTTGLFYSFLDLCQSDSDLNHTEGLLPVALASVTLTTMHTKMTKGFLCGVSFPTMALPWVLLIITTAVIPHSVLPCNIIAILVGWAHGKGWCSRVDLSEAKAGILEKKMPFRLLKSIHGAVFVPASTEGRRKTILPQINPTPGSYPVQAYAPLSNINAADAAGKLYEGWPSSSGAPSSPTPPVNPHGNVSSHNFGLGHGHYSEHHSSHSCNHGHSHGQL